MKTLTDVEVLPITTFKDAGVMAGLISLPITVPLYLLGMGILIPLTGMNAGLSLLGDDEQSIILMNEYYQKAANLGHMEARNKIATYSKKHQHIIEMQNKKNASEQR